jgi:hypothetical protein
MNKSFAAGRFCRDASLPDDLQGFLRKAGRVRPGSGSPWDGTEIYVNPELMQGFGLSNTLEAAGFPDGEAQKIGLSDAAFQCRAHFPAPDSRPRRRAGDDRGRSEPAWR